MWQLSKHLEWNGEHVAPLFPLPLTSCPPASSHSLSLCTKSEKESWTERRSSIQLGKGSVALLTCEVSVSRLFITKLIMSESDRSYFSVL